MNRFRPVRRLLTVIFAVMVVCGGGMAADEITRALAGKHFRKAFGPGLALKERKKKLKELVEDYKATIWTDDASWCLIQLDLHRGNYQEVLKRAKKLFEGNRIPSLEPFTRRTFIYQNSRMPAVVWILERNGCRYRRTGRKYRVKVFNALPMTLRADMGRAAEKVGKLDKALKHYKQAVSLSPGGTLFRRSYRQQVRRLKTKLKYREKATTITESKASDPKNIEADESEKQGKKPEGDPST